MGEGAAAPKSGELRRALLDELRAVEREWKRVRAGLAELGPGEKLPGLHLVVRVGGGRALLPAARIAEIARVVAFDPVPGAPAWLSGAFVWRGAPSLAVDLGARLGAAPNTSLDTVIVILDGAPTVALLVDEVLGLSEDPVIGDGGGEGARSPVFAGTCQVGGEAVPLLAIGVLEREVGEFA
jgi:chemotaxis protein histidine kinase CheA